MAVLHPPDQPNQYLHHQTLVLMPAHAGIHIHGPVFMDTGVRRYDTQENLRFNLR